VGPRARRPGWAQLAAELPGRLKKQARERYSQVLNPGMRPDAWSPLEEAQLNRRRARREGSHAGRSARLAPKRQLSLNRADRSLCGTV
jgi:myb proto-oncogene protein